MNIHKTGSWLSYALATTLCWGVWGALIELPEKNGFPATLGYIAWAITMIPCAIIALKIINWKLDKDVRSVLLGMTVGLTGAGGQILLFQALREGPAYLIFPIISLYPILTILLSIFILRETATTRQLIGIVLALAAIYLLSISDGNQSGTHEMLWLILAGTVFIFWAIQAFVMKFSNQSMKAESIFFYMTISALTMIPAAYFMTDFNEPINFGLNGGWFALLIHFLNSIGALTLVYALRFGKAIIVVPLTGLSPLITIGLSLLIYGIWPEFHLLIGMAVALVAIYLISD